MHLLRTELSQKGALQIHRYTHGIMLLGGYRFNPIHEGMQYLFESKWICMQDLSHEQLKIVFSHHIKDELCVPLILCKNTTNMKRKATEMVEIVGNYEYVNSYPLQNESCVKWENCRKNDLVWAARKKDGFRLFSATIIDVNPGCAESVELMWTDSTQTDLLVNVCYIFPRYWVYNSRIRKGKPLHYDKVAEWLFKNSNHCPPSDSNFCVVFMHLKCLPSQTSWHNNKSNLSFKIMSRKHQDEYSWTCVGITWAKQP